MLCTAVVCGGATFALESDGSTTSAPWPTTLVSKGAYSMSRWYQHGGRDGTSRQSTCLTRRRHGGGTDGWWHQICIRGRTTFGGSSATGESHGFSPPPPLSLVSLRSEGDSHGLSAPPVSLSLDMSSQSMSNQVRSPGPFSHGRYEAKSYGSACMGRFTPSDSNVLHPFI